MKGEAIQATGKTYRGADDEGRGGNQAQEQLLAGAFAKLCL
jgi:hypothetical protein